MPSLKLSNPFRRGVDRPSLKQRAASLRATAARVMSRKPASPSTDPIFAALDRYQAARAAWDAFSDRLKADGWEAHGGVKVASEKEGRLSHAWSVLSSEVLGTVPTTEAGRLALADFIETWVADHGNTDGSPQDGSETVFAEVYPALLRAVRLSVGQSAPPAAKAAPPIARDFIDSLDLSAAQMRDLAAIYDAAALIGGVADAVSCQPRAYGPKGEAWNVIGLFADAISEACGAVQADAVREARRRAPADDWERGQRLKILAEDTIENGDKGAVLAFARDLQVMG